MKEPALIGLLGGGNIARSAIGRLPQLTDHLGPVKASSFRVASRIANHLRAGEAVRTTAAFDACGMILVCVPDPKLAVAIRDLEASGISWQHRSIVLCDSLYDAAMLAGLADRGARVASLVAVAGFLVLEGDRLAIRDFRRVTRLPDRRFIVLSADSKPLFLAGVTLAGHTAHLASAATDCLRTAGVRTRPSRTLIRSLMNDATHAYYKGGKRATQKHRDEEQWRSVRRELAALRDQRPDLAGFFSVLMSASMRLSGQDSPAAQHAP